MYIGASAPGLVGGCFFFGGGGDLKIFEGSFDAICHVLKKAFFCTCTLNRPIGEILKYNRKLSNFVHFLDTIYHKR